MDYRTVLNHFNTCTRENAEAWRTSMSLSMPYDTILYCADHYRNCERRDPMADELRMLDRLSLALEKEPDVLCPAEVLIHDGPVAVTYADLLDKRRYLDPEASYPCTLTEAARLSTRYLHYAGKDALPARAALLPEAHFLPGVPSGAAFLDLSPFRLLPFAANSPRAKAGDLLVLITPREGAIRARFLRALQALLSSEGLLSSLAGMWSVKEGGLMPTLLSISEGLWIDLSHLSPSGLSMPMTALTDHYAGCCVLRIPEKALQAMQAAGKDKELFVLPFAKVTDGGEYRFSRSRRESFTLTSGFLKRLYHYRRGRAALPAEQSDAAMQISHALSTQGKCRYLKDGAGSCRTFLAGNGLLTSGAFGTSRSAPFRTALCTSLLPVMTLAAVGIPYTEQTLSVGLQLPSDGETDEGLGASLATVLGWYRASSECSLAAEVQTVFAEVGSAPGVTVYATAPGKALSDTFTAAGKKVYCITPAWKADGILDFDALRSLLNTLTEWSRAGSISAAYAFAGRTVTDALCEMRGAFACRLEDPKLAAGDALPLAILLESDASLPLSSIGTVVQAARENAIKLPDAESLVWSEAPEILVIRRRTDRDAEALAGILSECGCHAVCLSDEEEGPLSRALLTAQTVILCSDAALPESERMQFARKVAKESGCRLLSFNKEKDSPADFLPIPGGLNRESLSLLTFFEKNEKK